MTEVTDGDNERARLEEEIRKPIRPQVTRPHGFAVPADRETIERENALMQELHERAVDTARREKLKLLCRYYSLAEDDYVGLALELAIKHEPGFQAIDRQLVELPVADDDRKGLGFRGPVLVKNGKLIDTPSGRPVEWSLERLLQLIEAVEEAKKKFSLTTDLDALKHLAGKPEWAATLNSKGYDAWVSTLQKRLPEAKAAKRTLNALTLDVREGRAIWATRELEDANRARVQALLDDGLSVRDIADETGIPKSTVHRIKKAIEATGGEHAV
jgi:Homeodomain-like domain